MTGPRTGKTPPDPTRIAEQIAGWGEVEPFAQLSQFQQWRREAPDQLSTALTIVARRQDGTLDRVIEGVQQRGGGANQDAWSEFLDALVRANYQQSETLRGIIAQESPPQLEERRRRIDQLLEGAGTGETRRVLQTARELVSAQMEKLSGSESAYRSPSGRGGSEGEPGKMTKAEFDETCRKFGVKWENGPGGAPKINLEDLKATVLDPNSDSLEMRRLCQILEGVPGLFDPQRKEPMRDGNHIFLPLTSETGGKVLVARADKVQELLDIPKMREALKKKQFDYEAEKGGLIFTNPGPNPGNGVWLDQLEKDPEVLAALEKAAPAPKEGDRSFKEQLLDHNRKHVLFANGFYYLPPASNGFIYVRTKEQYERELKGKMAMYEKLADEWKKMVDDRKGWKHWIGNYIESMQGRLWDAWGYDETHNGMKAWEIELRGPAERMLGLLKQIREDMGYTDPKLNELYKSMQGLLSKENDLHAQVDNVLAHWWVAPLLAGGIVAAPEAVFIGAALTTTIAGGRQYAEILQGTRKEFDIDELIMSGLEGGALAGPLSVLAKYKYVKEIAGVAGAYLAGTSAYEEFKQGHGIVGAYDAATAAFSLYLGFKGGRVQTRPSEGVESFRVAQGPPRTGWVRNGNWLPRVFEEGATAPLRGSQIPGALIRAGAGQFIPRFASRAGAKGHATEEARAPGEEPARAGEEPARAGEEPARAGEEPARAGEEPVRAGEEPVRAGEEPVRAGEEPARAGEEPARAGEEPAKAPREEATKTAEETPPRRSLARRARDLATKPFRMLRSAWRRLTTGRIARAFPFATIAAYLHPSHLSPPTGGTAPQTGPSEPGDQPDAGAQPEGGTTPDEPHATPDETPKGPNDSAAHGPDPSGNSGEGSPEAPASNAQGPQGTPPETPSDQKNQQPAGGGGFPGGLGGGSPAGGGGGNGGGNVVGVRAFGFGAVGAFAHDNPHFVGSAGGGGSSGPSLLGNYFQTYRYRLPFDFAPEGLVQREAGPGGPSGGLADASSGALPSRGGPGSLLRGVKAPERQGLRGVTGRDQPMLDRAQKLLRSGSGLR